MEPSNTDHKDAMVIGIDVGGTNTDAILWSASASSSSTSSSSSSSRMVASVKVPSHNPAIPNYYYGIAHAMQQLFQQLPDNNNNHHITIAAVFVGTTAFVNALLQGSSNNLDRVAVVRLCGPSSRSLPPFSDFPPTLRRVISAGWYLARGGLRFDGSPECHLDQDDLAHIAQQIVVEARQHSAQNHHVVVSGTFSPSDPSQEEQAACIVQDAISKAITTTSTQQSPRIHVSTASSCTASLGLLARENSAIVNASLQSTARRVAAHIRAALSVITTTTTTTTTRHKPKLYFTCNDGAVVTFGQAAHHPLRCVQCGPTNSLRGAAHLLHLQMQMPIMVADTTTTTNTTTTTTTTTTASDNRTTNTKTAMDRIVLDIGGTTTDAGCLVGGIYPRDSNAEAYVAGIVRCNHRMTMTVSIALGGGSIIVFDNEGKTVDIGPESVGSEIGIQALCFGGTVCTATCIAVAMMETAAVLSCDNNNNDQPMTIITTSDFEVPSFAAQAWDVMQQQFCDLVERTRVNKAPVEVVLVGGGTGLVDAPRLAHALGNDCRVVRPPHASVANACGSALAQNVGEAETIADLSIANNNNNNRESIVAQLYAKACQRAGPHAEVIECEEVPLAYLPGKMTRIFVRAIAPLDIFQQAPQEEEEEMEQSSSHLESNTDHDVLDGGDLESSSQQQPNTKSSPQTAPMPSEKNISKDDGMWTISEYDAHCLAIGCGILGCGGGGSTYHAKLQLLRALQEGSRIRVVSIDDLPAEAVIAPCGLMGAPSVSLEMLESPEQVAASVHHAFSIYQHHQQAPNNTDASLSSIPPQQLFIASSEIGGSNGIMPLLVGNLMDLPVVDADFMGRAFPELQMTTTSIYGLPQTPMVISDSFGRCVAIHQSATGTTEGLIPADDSYWTERVLRPVCVEFGCVAGLTDRLLTREEIQRVGVRQSLSRARRIGDCILRSSHPDEAVDRMLKQEGGKCIFRGMISDVERETTKGFAVGTLTLVSEDKKSTMTVQFQNEFLIARKTKSGNNSHDDDDSVVIEGCVPDIISILDADTARPIATEEVRFGFRVLVIILPVSELLRTEEALRFVGPKAFGLKDTCTSTLGSASI